MKMSDRGLAELAGHEGIVSRRYKDSVGVWTLGVGHTAAAGAPDPITVTSDMLIGDVMALFRKDVAQYEAAVDKALSVAVTQTEFDALVSFHYNTGAIGRATLVKSLNAGDRDAASAQFMSWKTPSSIIGRRTKEMILFRDGAYQNGGKANVYPASDAGVVLWAKGKTIDVLALLTQSAPAEAGVDGASTPPVTRPTIRLGSKGPDVAAWQAIVGAKADGDFGEKTKAATKAWQKARGLVDDGVAGPKTWAAGS
ncbi:glycoside hydrolase family protein [Hansschlegelia plantiphila]|uniref:Lysozyme n=1 Tax=Hansschlegelia plantiphila TaxID=374655 RepID=A0A9W6IZG2_9HYPH|nr:glycoside hydrolase family protein [Hansschlegelia plantiphila]GLK66996.1 hypothetical protein GCM10008179_06340 [Hansschlegelia plantiphila]